MVGQVDALTDLLLLDLVPIVLMGSILSLSLIRFLEANMVKFTQMAKLTSRDSQNS